MLKLRRQPEPSKPQFRGEVVTICIAVVSQGSRIIFAWDGQISSPETSTEGAMKFTTLSSDESWVAMFAGDVHRFGPLTERIRKSLTAYDRDSLVSACEAAFKIELLKRIETEILLPYGLTREQFIENGRAWFGDMRFGFIADQIAGMDLGIHLLVAGLDPSGVPHIFSMDEKGVVFIQDQLPFHAVGSGRFNALATLYPDPGLFYTATLNKAIYRLCAAKFAAESASGVGKETTIIARERDGTRSILFPWTIEKIRERWKAEGQPPIPDGVIDLIDKDLVRPGRFGSNAVVAAIATS
jgi:ATP-dependent protease HslVU (ClpYQ) peptidase subunit